MTDLYHTIEVKSAIRQYLTENSRVWAIKEIQTYRHILLGKKLKQLKLMSDNQHLARKVFKIAVDDIDGKNLTESVAAKAYIRLVPIPMLLHFSLLLKVRGRSTP